MGCSTIEDRIKRIHSLTDDRWSGRKIARYLSISENGQIASINRKPRRKQLNRNSKSIWSRLSKEITNGLL